MAQRRDDGFNDDPSSYGQEWRQVGVINAALLPRFCDFFNMYTHRKTFTRIGLDSENELRIFRCKNWPAMACPLEMHAQRLIGPGGNYYVVKKEMHRNCEWEEGKIRNGGKAAVNCAVDEEDIKYIGKNITKKGRKSKINNEEESTIKSPVSANSSMDNLAPNNNNTPPATIVSRRNTIWQYVCTLHSAAELEKARQRHYVRHLSAEHHPNNLRCRRVSCEYRMLLRNGEKGGERLLYERNEHNHAMTQQNRGRKGRQPAKANRSIKIEGSPCLDVKATPKHGTRGRGVQISKRRQQPMEEEEEEEEEERETASEDDDESQQNQLLPLPNNADRHAQFVKMAKELGLNCNSLLGDTFFCAPGNAALNLTLGVNDRIQAVQIIGSAGNRVLDVQQRMAGKMRWVWALGRDWPQFLWALRGLAYLFFSSTPQRRQEGSDQCEVQEPSAEERSPENAKNNAPAEFSIVQVHPELPIEGIIGYLESAVQLQREVGGFAIWQKHSSAGGVGPSNSASTETKVTFLQDQQGSVRVREIAKGKTISEERWRKIGREQFCYAVLGKCAAVFQAKKKQQPNSDDDPSAPGTSGPK